MSSFNVEAHSLVVLPHSNADALELAQVGGYLSVVRKGEFVTGDLAIYIPEAALLPDALLKEIGLWDEEKGKGRLAGGEGRRIRAARLRGVLSQGITFSPDPAGPYAGLLPLQEGVDYAEALGVIKYVPPIPAELAGQVEHTPGLKTYTDLENIKRFPNVIQEGELVYISEKLHGTNSVLSLIRDGSDFHFAVSSKGQAGKQLGILRALDERGRDTNAYWRMAVKVDAERVLREIAARLDAKEITLFGETLGVQDLMYGLPKGELDFRAFDLRVDGEFLPYGGAGGFLDLMGEYGIPTVPVLWVGPFSQDALDHHTGGNSVVEKAGHIREGVVVRPTEERYDPTLGRVVLKSISASYLLRKGEATEYE